MNTQTRASDAFGSPWSSITARLVMALSLLAIAGLLVLALILSSEPDGLMSGSARTSLIAGIGMVFALLGALLFSVWTALKANCGLLEIFEQASPEAALRLALEQQAPTAECRRLVTTFSNLIAQMQESQRQLHISEERFALAMDAANEGIWDWHLLTNSVYFSPRWKQMLGYADHELANIVTEWEQRVHPDDRERAKAAIAEHLSGNTCCYELEHRLLHKDGSYRWVLSRGIAVRNADGKPYRIAGSHSDITERKRAEEELRVSETRFRALFELSPFAIQLFTPDGRMLHANQAYLRLWGLASLEQLANFNLLEDEQLAAAGLMPLIRQGLAGERALIPPMRYNPGQTAGIASGRPRWVKALMYPIKDADSPLREVAVIFDDMTERKEAEEALDVSEARFRTIFEGAAIGIALISKHGRLIESNAALQQMLGYSADELRQMSAIEVTHAADLRADVNLYLELLDCRRDAYQIEKRYIRKDGTIVWARLTVSLIRGGSDDDQYGVVMIENIDEQKRVAEQLSEREAQYRSIFEATSDGLIINDRDTGLVIEVNPAMCAMHGYAYDELIGMHPTTFIHSSYHHVFGEYVDTIRRGETFQTQALDVRKDGSLLHVEVHGSSLIYKGKPHILGVIRDITDRVQAYELLEQRVAERTRELSTLLEVSHNVASTLELKPLLGLILDQLKSVVDYNGAAIYIVEGDYAVVEGYRGPIPDEVAIHMRYPLAKAGIIWDVITSGKPAIIADTHGDTPLARVYQAVVGEELNGWFSYIRNWMGVPLLLKDRLLGMLTVTHGTSDHFTEQHARLALAIANHAAVAIENARLFEQAQGLAALMERQRLARELHDSVSQALYGIALGARTARTLLDRDPSRLAEPLDYVLSLAEAGLTEMRALIFELRPESLELEGLVAALTKQAAAMRARHQIDVRTKLCAEPDLSIEGKEVLYRIAQEALHNIVKHAQASRVELQLAWHEDHLELCIQDNGQGFDPTSSFPGHLGLRSMRERANRIGGKLDLHSTAGGGTLIRACVPG
jgi:PAS domain S-box-containing protein